MSELIKIEEINKVEVFSNNDYLQSILDKIKAETISFVPNTETATGRKEIASLARKVASSKVAIDSVGKELVTEWKKKAKLVDSSRKVARDYLDNLRDEIRRPLTEWEAEEKRKEEEATFAKAEEERLAAEKVLAEQQAREAEFKRKEEELAEKQRLIEEAARVELIKREAEEKARREAEQRLIDERVQSERRIQQALIDKELAVKAEQERAKNKAERIERERLAELTRLQKIEDDRKANEDHRRRVNQEALSTLTSSINCDEELGKRIITAIIHGKIKNITINY